MPANDGEYTSTLYVDDGETINSEYDNFVFKLTKGNGSTNIEINRGGSFNKVKRFYLTFNGGDVKKIVADGKEVTIDNNRFYIAGNTKRININ